MLRCLWAASHAGGSSTLGCRRRDVAKRLRAVVHLLSTWSGAGG